MCIHDILISNDTGVLIKSSFIKEDDLKDNLYTCNGCNAIFKFKDGVLVGEVLRETSAQLNIQGDEYYDKYKRKQYD